MRKKDKDTSLMAMRDSKLGMCEKSRPLLQEAGVRAGVGRCADQGMWFLGKAGA